MTKTRVLDAAVVVALVLYPLLLPGYLDLGTRMIVMALFAMSLDLLVGYCGLVTLGHAAFFGVGAYSAGILAIRASADPLTGLLAGGVAAAILGLLAGTVLLRSRRLTLIMLTLATVLIVQETANRMNWLTGGADGLQGIDMDPVLGRFAFDLFGRVGYVYAAAVLALGFLVFRAVVDSNFGKSLVGIRENEPRMRAIGAPVDTRLRIAFVMSAALAGIAGALQAQVTEFVSLNAVSVEFSGEILIMLILGGAGRRYGAFLGAPLYVFMQDYLAKEDPANWYLWIGAMLMAIVLFAPGGLTKWIGALVGRATHASPLPGRS
ncbi:MAG: branched-chain amino acid ABC transporter permease [Acidimicrobiia bacterium]|nr:branched-chain amino acid ABC transporter permease [Acidimicrobiia bacterium]